jgi:hypothetical protein
MLSEQKEDIRLVVDDQRVIPREPTREPDLSTINENIWNSCCGSHVDKRSAQFFSGLVISLLVLAMSIAKVLLEPEKANTVFINLIVLILGIYTPSPTIQSAPK